jgi:hypothetical protein
MRSILCPTATAQEEYEAAVIGNDKDLWSWKTSAHRAGHRRGIVAGNYRIRNEIGVDRAALIKIWLREGVQSEKSMYLSPALFNFFVKLHGKRNIHLFSSCLVYH